MFDVFCAREYSAEAHRSRVNGNFCLIFLSLKKHLTDRLKFGATYKFQEYLNRTIRIEHTVLSMRTAVSLRSDINIAQVPIVCE